jgi:hypothetical protein
MRQRLMRVLSNEDCNEAASDRAIVRRFWAAEAPLGDAGRHFARVPACGSESGSTAGGRVIDLAQWAGSRGQRARSE